MDGGQCRSVIPVQSVMATVPIIIHPRRSSSCRKTVVGDRDDDNKR